LLRRVKPHGIDQDDMVNHILSGRRMHRAGLLIDNTGR
jgi:hypothetical protein